MNNFKETRIETKMGLDCTFVSRLLTEQEKEEGVTMYDDSYIHTSYAVDCLGFQHGLLRVIDHMPYAEFNLRGYHLFSYNLLRKDILDFVSWLMINRIEENRKHYEDGQFTQYWTDKRTSSRVCVETDAQILLSFVKELDDNSVPLDYFVMFY